MVFFMQVDFRNNFAHIVVVGRRPLERRRRQMYRTVITQHDHSCTGEVRIAAAKGVHMQMSVQPLAPFNQPNSGSFDCTCQLV